MYCIQRPPMERDSVTCMGHDKSRPGNGRLPDNARVYCPPAATLAILIPGFNVTRHGNAERVSSPDDELSAACFAEFTLLRFELSSPALRASVAASVPPVDREP